MTQAITLKLLTGKRDEMNDLQRVLEDAPAYALRLTGHPPGSADAQSTFSILPPDRGYEDKFVFGIYRGDIMVGCVDLIRAYPDAKTAMLGLFLLSQKFEGQGFGRQAFRLLEDFVRGWEGCEKIRIGIVLTNADVTPFWEKMGFVDTGTRKPYAYDKLTSQTSVFEKQLR